MGSTRERVSSAIYCKATRDLDTNTNYIRLIRLQPGDSDSPICCTLQRVQLGQTGDFTALSYAWGEPDPAYEIMLNDQPFRVRKNLWDFLHQARKSMGGQLLWVDAVSINQENFEERNHQVTLMGQIYRKAAKVVVWLGAGTHLTDIAMRVLQFPCDYESTMFTAKEKAYVQSLESPPRAIFLSHPITDPESPRLLRYYALRKLLTIPYWRRLWVQQEFMLAKRIEICCGAMVVDAEAADIITALTNMQYRNNFSDLDIFRRRLSWLQDSEKTGGLNFKVLLSDFVSLRCQDPPDRVYGMLGLVSPEQLKILELVPDYTKDQKSLYEHIMQRFPELPSDQEEGLSEGVSAAYLRHALRVNLDQPGAVQFTWRD